uniref:Sperm tail PG-rich repeat containing 1 n=1 Tax=Naja naja TaxID=35670 RepID=A0A8C6X8N2_NAJNA
MRAVLFSCRPAQLKVFYTHTQNVVTEPVVTSIESHPCYFLICRSNENPGPGLYNIIHQSMLLDNVSQSRKGTCFFPSLVRKIRIPNYPASNAYDISPTLHAKKDFSLGYSSMFHPPFARKIAKKTGPPQREGRWRAEGQSGLQSVKHRKSVVQEVQMNVYCHYRINDSLIRASPQVLVSCFRSKTGRTTDPETLSPGPAAYQQPLEILKSHFPNPFQKCILNFSAPAVPPPQNPPLPGPGQYNIVDYTAPSKHYISSAVFVSNTKRWTSDKFHKGIPGPGENITVTGLCLFLVFYLYVPQ